MNLFITKEIMMNKKPIMKRQNDKNVRVDKTLEQKIASAQMRLNRLKTKEKSLSKSAETRLKIILGAEVAKAMGCKVEDVDKEFVLGILLQTSNINAEAKARVKIEGKRFLENMVGRQE